MDSDAFTRFRNRGEPTNGQSCSPTKAIMRCSGKFATAYWSTYHQLQIWVKHSYTPKRRIDCFCNIEIQHSDFSLKYSGFGQITKSYYQGWRNSNWLWRCPSDNPGLNCNIQFDAPNIPDRAWGASIPRAIFQGRPCSNDTSLRTQHVLAIPEQAVLSHAEFVCHFVTSHTYWVFH